MTSLHTYNRKRGHFILILYPDHIARDCLTSFQLDIISTLNRDLRDICKTIRPEDSEGMVERIDEFVKLVSRFKSQVAELIEERRVNKLLLVPYRQTTLERLEPLRNAADAVFMYDANTKQLVS